MRLLEAIIQANHRALEGDTTAGLRPADYEAELPVAALTCIDARLNPLLPEVLGIPEEQFIWLRNAGNIITGPMSSTMRSLALACAVKGGKQILIIGHTDCGVAKTSTLQLLDRLKAVGIERHLLPDNITEFFGTFGSERQNVIKAADLVRHSPIIGPKIPVHGLLVDTATGKLEWLVNGYDNLGTVASPVQQAVQSTQRVLDALENLQNIQIGDFKFPETKIGETVTKAEQWVEKQLEKFDVQVPPTLETHAPQTATPAPHPPPLPRPPGAHPGVPPPLRPRLHFRKGLK